MRGIHERNSQDAVARRICGHTLRIVLCDSRGGALVELALVAPILIALALGAADFGRLAYFSIEASNAARAGAAYAAQSTATSIDTSGIRTAAAHDAPNLTGIATLTVTSNPVCQCANGTSFSTVGTTTAACAAAILNCASPHRVINYVQVNTSAPVATMFRYPGIPTSITLRGQAIMRIK